MRKRCAVLLALIIWTCTVSATDRSGDVSWHEFRARIEHARVTLTGDFKVIDQRSKLAANLEERLDSALGRFTPGGKPEWLSDSVYANYALAVAGLNATLIDQLATGRSHILSNIRGSDDVPFKSAADGTQQPLAIFVPAGYNPHLATPLVIFLHGQSQTEADEIASPWIREAASATGAIVAAPYARGDAQYAGVAPQEIYQTVSIMEHAFNIDGQRVYLAGHSMGGFGVFSVGSLRPHVWTAFLCASGSMTEEDKATALQRFAGKPVYIVQGSQDSIVPALYARRTAHWLEATGIPVRYYEQPGGQHSLGTIAQAFSRAWSDMLAGVTSKTPIPDENASP